MTFRTLQVGVASELPRLEYSCLSSRLRAEGLDGRTSLSQFAYRELRDQVLSKRMEFWLGIPDAEIIETVPLDEGRVLLRAESHGHEIELEMVREDFWQIWASDEKLADEPLPLGSFPSWVEIYQVEKEPPMVAGGARLPADLAGQDLEALNRQLTEFRIAREWKIDRIIGLEAVLEN
ncbi:MAG: hypothetical protein ACI8X5_000566 [Planctomycetota bacterium]|jgi:hypothetical protein